MGYTVTIMQVEAQPIAAARARMAARDIASRFKQPLDKVWEFLGLHPELRPGGHNVFLYRHDMDTAGAMTIDFGVQVVSPFQGRWRRLLCDDARGRGCYHDALWVLRGIGVGSRGHSCLDEKEQTTRRRLELGNLRRLER